MSKTHIDCVKEFMQAAGQYDPAATFMHNGIITLEELKTIRLRLSLISEEVLELYQAVLNADSLALTDIESYFKHIQQITKAIELEDVDFDRIEVGDAITDIDYINTGSAVAFDIPLETCFDAVHNNNMTKVDPVTGKCLKNEQGKIIKPHDYIPVDLSTILKR